jgi:hypothetical protein
MKHNAILKSIYWLTCTGLILANLNLIGMTYKSSGWDYRVYCGAAKAFDAGKDPYVVDNIQPYSDVFFSFAYPPITLVLFKAACVMKSAKAYYLIWTVLLLAIVLIVNRAIKDPDALFLLTLILTGFVTIFWSFYTGNAALVEAFVFSIGYYFVLKKRYQLGAMFVTLSSIFKILPIVFAVLLLLIHGDWKKKLKVGGVAAATFILMHGASLLLFPGISKTYYSSILGNVPNQHTPITETGGLTNPAPMLFVSDLSEKIFGPNNVAFFVLYSIVILCVGVLFFNFARINRGKSDDDFGKVFSLGIIAIYLILPRLKPYSFAPALLAIGFLANRYRYSGKMIVSGIISLLPIILYWVGQRSSGAGGNLFLGYGQLICLFLFYGYFLVKEAFSMNPRQPPGRAPAARSLPGVR